MIVTAFAEGDRKTLRNLLSREVYDGFVSAISLRESRGETIEFKGRAKTTGGEDRRVEGRAQPTDATSGKIKVRVFVSQKIQLIFNTTYRFVPEISQNDPK